MATLRVPVTSADYIRGPAIAPVTLVEYGDYECPHCGLAQPEVMRVLDHFHESVRLVFRHFPLNQIHPHAEPAAETAEFAGGHRLFWEMHDHLFENQDRLGLALFLALAEALNLSQEELTGALASGTFTPKVRADFMGGVRSGVNGTPTFFINGRRHDGAYAFEELAAAVALLLRTPVTP
jgi:protein-disulfide isomerase